MIKWIPNRGWVEWGWERSKGFSGDRKGPRGPCEVPRSNRQCGMLSGILLRHFEIRQRWQGVMRVCTCLPARFWEQFLQLHSPLESAMLDHSLLLCRVPGKVSAQERCCCFTGDGGWESSAKKSLTSSHLELQTGH